MVESANSNLTLSLSTAQVAKFKMESWFKHFKSIELVAILKNDKVRLEQN